MPPPTDHFARLFDYEFRCTDIVVQSLHQAQRTVEQLSLASLAAPLERAIAIFCHVQAARRLWLHRIRPDLTPFPPDGVFPIWRLIKAEQEARDLDGLWKACIDDLPSRDLTALIPYTSTEGVAYQSTLADILRGQPLHLPPRPDRQPRRRHRHQARRHRLHRPHPQAARLARLGYPAFPRRGRPALRPNKTIRCSNPPRLHISVVKSRRTAPTLSPPTPRPMLSPDMSAARPKR